MLNPERQPDWSEPFIPPLPWPGKFQDIPYAPTLQGDALKEFHSLLRAELRFRVDVIRQKQDLLGRAGISLDEFVPNEEAEAIIRSIDVEQEMTLEGGKQFVTPWASSYWETSRTLGSDIGLATTIERVLEQFGECDKLSFSDFADFMKSVVPALELDSFRKITAQDVVDEDDDGIDPSDLLEAEAEKSPVHRFHFDGLQDALDAGGEIAAVQSVEKIFTYWQVCTGFNPRLTGALSRISERSWSEPHDVFCEDSDELFQYSAEQLLVQYWQFDLSDGMLERGRRLELTRLEASWDQVLTAFAVKACLIDDTELLISAHERGEFISFKDRAQTVLSGEEIDRVYQMALEEVSEIAASYPFQVNWNVDRFRALVDPTREHLA